MSNRYCGDIPHTVTCDECDKVFWTGDHSSKGKCEACGGGITEMDPVYAKEIQDSCFRGFTNIGLFDKDMMYISCKSLFDRTLISLYQDQCASVRLSLNENAISTMMQELEKRGYEILPGTGVPQVIKRSEER